MNCKAVELVQDFAGLNRMWILWIFFKGTDIWRIGIIDAPQLR